MALFRFICNISNLYETLCDSMCNIYMFAPVFICGGDSTVRQSLVVVFLLSAGILVLALPALRTLSRQGRRFSMTK